MSMTRFRARQPAKALDFTIGRRLIVGLAGAIIVAGTFAIDNVSVDSVFSSKVSGSADAALAAACGKWHLTTEQAARFLSISVRITAEEMHAVYYWLPCSISGTGMLQGHHMQFEINAAATAYIKTDDGNEIRLGCPDDSCKQLVLMEGGVPERDMAP